MVFFVYLKTNYQKMSLLNILSTKHNEWVRMVKTFDSIEYAEDIVQEMYIKLHYLSIKNPDSIDKILIENEPNEPYIWFILMNMSKDYLKSKGKVQKVEFEEYMVTEQDNLEYLEEFTERLMIEENNWHWYERKLYEMNIIQGISLRKIEELTGIDYSSVFKTVRNCKEKIKTNVKY